MDQAGQTKTAHQRQVLESVARKAAAQAKAAMDPHGMRSGAKRRAAIVARVRATGSLYVNLKRTLSTERDADLKALLKKGVLVRDRTGGSRQGPMSKKAFKRCTFLTLGAGA